MWSRPRALPLIEKKLSLGPPFLALTPLSVPSAVFGGCGDRVFTQLSSRKVEEGSCGRGQTTEINAEASDLGGQLRRRDAELENRPQLTLR